MNPAPINNLVVRKIWVYLSEIILAFLVLWHVTRWIDYDSVKSIVVEHTATWSTLCSILFAARIALWVLFNNMAMKPFGVWLEKLGLLDTIQNALAWPLLVFPACIVVCMLTKSFPVPYMVYFSVLLLSYSFLNLLTMVSNTRQLVRLSIRYDMEASKEGRKV